jgi:hypothetical protein
VTVERAHAPNLGERVQRRETEHHGEDEDQGGKAEIQRLLPPSRRGRPTRRAHAVPRRLLVSERCRCTLGVPEDKRAR